MSIDAPADPVPSAATVPRWVRLLLLVTVWALLLASVTDATLNHLRMSAWELKTIPGFASPRHPATTLYRGVLLAHLYVLVPVFLLFALFCARRGVERGQALETGTLPGLLLFGWLMFISRMVRSIPPAWPFFARSGQGVKFALGRMGDFAATAHVDGPSFALLLLACFATARADPPAPSRARVGWMLVAAALGAWCVYGEANALGSVTALLLYAAWSVRQGIGHAFSEAGTSSPVAEPAATANPSVPARLPMAPARRIIGLLLFVALMGLPAAMVGVVQNGVRNGEEFITVPLSVATGLILISGLEGPADRMTRLLGYAVLAGLVISTLLGAMIVFSRL